MDFATILTSRDFPVVAVILGALIGGWIIWKLHLFFFHRIQFFFSRHAYADEKINQRLNRFAWGLTILFPVWFLSAALWIKIIQNKNELWVMVYEKWVAAYYLAANFFLLFVIFRLIAFFSRCYKMRQKNEQSPIPPIIRFLFALLIFYGVIIVGTVLTKERPITLLSMLGGALFLFVFAFQHLISSLVANVQISAEKMLKVGDWIVIKNQGIDGIVVSVSSVMIKVRNWDMSLVSCPVRLLLNETLVNYQSMIESGARRIAHSLLIDQRSIRFLTGDEVAELKKIRLVTDEMLKKSDPFPETDDFTGGHCWTNIELFSLYVEDYLHRRPDIRHDVTCLVRTQKTTSQGMELELFCFSIQTSLAEFAPVQRSVLFHLLAILPSFRLRVFQECSDIYQEIGDVPDKIGSTFRYDQLKKPIYPSKRL